ncbi:MAG: bacillolysin, partial [Longispora sp.]|nr:bacillolysin [Longispora sp. (in: high G+C Gram-positive bacteria)]
MTSFVIPARRMFALGLGAVLVTTAAFAGSMSAKAQAPDPDPDPMEGLSLIAVRESLLATHYWYEQSVDGHPVLGGFLGKHVDRSTGDVTLDDGRFATSSLNRAARAAVPAERADELATRATGAPPYRTRLVILPEGGGSLVWQVLTEPVGGSVSTLVDAASGKVISSTSLVKKHDGTGKVFDPSPTVSLQAAALGDSNDRDVPEFQGAYKTMVLPRLDGTGTLNGDFARNMSKQPVKSATSMFMFNRSQREFEQVMGYYHITKAQNYLRSLGFTEANGEAQKYRTTGLTDDNSYYDSGNDQITFGTGGVDDAEDAEIIWHEYGHAIHDAQVPGFGRGREAGAIGEAFGDYMAYTMSQAVSPDSRTTPWACIGDWDAVSYSSETPHCLRRTDGVKMYPRDMEDSVHADGEIWSRALTDINT